MDEIIYLSFDDILMYYCDTIKQSGGGMSGIRERSGIEMVLDLVQNDLYYIFRSIPVHFPVAYKA